MPFSSTTREKGSKFKPKVSLQEYDNPRDRTKHEARRYLINKNETDDNFVGDYIYNAIGTLDDVFLNDSRLAAGLGILLGEQQVSALVISDLGKPSKNFNVKKYFKKERSKILGSLKKFYGKFGDGYKRDVEKLYKKWAEMNNISI